MLTPDEIRMLYEGERRCEDRKDAAIWSEVEREARRMYGDCRRKHGRADTAMEGRPKTSERLLRTLRIKIYDDY
jgi:hypothetical protein